MFATLQALKNTGSPDLQAVLEVVHEGEPVGFGPLRFVPNALMLLGLFGTVLGLAGSIRELGPVLEGMSTAATPDPSILVKSLSKTLREMQTAFVCTLWGIICAMCVSFVSSWFGSWRTRVLAELDEAFLGFAAPVLLPPSSEQQIREVGKTLKESTDYAGKLMDEAARRFENVQNDARGAINGSLEQLAEVSKKIESCLKNVGERVEKSTEALASGAEEIGKGSAALSGYHSELKKAFEKLHKLFTETQSKLETEVNRQVKEIGKVQQKIVEDAREQTNRLVKDVGGLQREFVESLGKNQQAAEEAISSKTKELVGELADRHATFVEQMGEFHKDLGRSAQTIVGRVDGASERLGEAATSFGAAGDSFIDAAIDLQGRFDVRFEGLADSVRQTPRSSSQRDGTRGGFASAHLGSA